MTNSAKAARRAVGVSSLKSLSAISAMVGERIDLKGATIEARPVRLLQCFIQGCDRVMQASKDVPMSGII